MTAKLQNVDSKARYAKRKHTVEPVFGQVKDVRGARRFQRRGLRACQAEWKLLCGGNQQDGDSRKGRRARGMQLRVGVGNRTMP